MLIIWFGYLIFLLNTKQELGAFGDSFGVINTLFTGLAFAGMMVTIFIQTKELRLQREELKLSREQRASPHIFISLTIENFPVIRIINIGNAPAYDISFNFDENIKKYTYIEKINQLEPNNYPIELFIRNTFDGLFQDIKQFKIDVGYKAKNMDKSFKETFEFNKENYGFNQSLNQTETKQLINRVHELSKKIEEIRKTLNKGIIIKQQLLISDLKVSEDKKSFFIKFNNGTSRNLKFDIFKGVQIFPNRDKIKDYNEISFLPTELLLYKVDEDQNLLSKEEPIPTNYLFKILFQKGYQF